jgi:hypothetical protein
LVLPIKIAPASRSRAVTGASRRATCSARNRDAAVVATPFMSTRSFSEIGIPWSGPR